MVYVPGLLTGQLSGKAGNTIARSGPFGPTIGVARATSTAPTPAKSSVTANFASLVGLYRSLAPTDLAAWKALGLTMPRVGRLSRPYNLTGIAAFLSVNRLLATLGLGPVTTAPTLTLPAALAITSVTAVGPLPGGGSLSMDLGTDPVPLDTSVVLFGLQLRASSILSPPRNNWKVFQVLSIGDTNPHDLASDYASVFGGFATGEAVWIKAIPVSHEGFAGPGQTKQVIAS